MPLTLNLTSFYRPTSSGIVMRDVGGNDQSFRAQFTPDGGYSIFYSLANNLVSGDTNNQVDIFRRDFQTGEIIRVSPDTGVPTSSYDLQISPNGRYVLFSSTAGNLVNGDNNGLEDVFCKDLWTQNITRVSTNYGGGEANGASVSGRFSPDGNYVIFTSRATNLARTADLNSTGDDLYRKDLRNGDVVLISSLQNGQQGSGNNWDAKYSADGSHVLFSSIAFGPYTGTTQVLIKNLGTGEVKLVSCDKDGNAGTHHSLEAQISLDGRYVVFASHGQSLVAFDSNDAYDIFRKDLQSGAIVRVSTSGTGGQSNGDSREPQISADGRYVVFTSKASNLVAGDNNGAQDVFRKDLVTGQIIRLSATIYSADGQGPVNDSYNPQISPDGRYVMFDSFSGLVPGDTDNGRDVYRVDTLLKENVLTVQAHQFVELAFDVGQASSVSIAWGDGLNSTVVPTGGKAAFNHAYATGGTKTATVSVSEGGQNWTVTYSVDLTSGQITRIAAAADQQVGGGGADVLKGDSFANILVGGAGNDMLTGMSGNDTLKGGAGKDVLSGGSGRDIFVFDTKPNKKTNIDKITDFNVKDDTIHLAKSAFSKIAKKGVLAKSAFWSGHDAKDGNDRISYDKKSGAVFYDSDGKGAHAAVQIATLQKNLKGFSHLDFFVV